jgi:hypothetical protein
MQDDKIRIIGDRKLFRPEGAAELLGKSTVTLKRWRMANSGPPVTRIGRDVYYDEAGLISWVSSCAKGSPA